MPQPKCHLDECIDRRLAALLRATDVDVTTVDEAATVGDDDEAQLLYATS